MHHIVTKMCTRVHISFTKCCMVGYKTAVLWHLCSRSTAEEMCMYLYWFNPMKSVRLLYIMHTKTETKWSPFCRRSKSPITQYDGSYNAWHQQAIRHYVNWNPATSPGLSQMGLNTLRPRQNSRHLADYVFKWIFLNENVWLSLKNSLKFIPQVSINNIPALVQIMAWRRSCDKPLSEPMIVILLTHVCVTRPQWVNRMMERFKPRNDNNHVFEYKNEDINWICLHALWSVIYFQSPLFWAGVTRCKTYWRFDHVEF